MYTFYNNGMMYINMADQREGDRRQNIPMAMGQSGVLGKLWSVLGKYGINNHVLNLIFIKCDKNGRVVTIFILTAQAGSRHICL